MQPEIKFCGLTRGADARAAAELGAGYVGVVLADGPRRLEPETAAAVLQAASEINGAIRRVGVFGTGDPGEIERAAQAARLDTVQLHGDPTPAEIAAVRVRYPGAIWAVLRVHGDVGSQFDELAEVADALVLDTLSRFASGGTGQAFDWEAAAASIVTRRGATRIILAGGLRPENVTAAIEAIRPAVVDVSSGVESAAGVKDHARMRAFALAVAGYRN